MSDEERDELIRRIGEHSAAGKPVVLCSLVPMEIGETTQLGVLPTPETMEATPLQWVRIVRQATRAEALAMPQPPGGWTWIEDSIPGYYYVVESD